MNAPKKSVMKEGLRKRCRVDDSVVTEEDLSNHYLEVITRCNNIPGPLVAWDAQRVCYGLKADRDYRKGEKVTEYGGRKSAKRVDGDYVAKSVEVFFDGKVDFRLSQKGRWINECDNKRTVVNVKLGRDVRALCDIKEGDWLFADYGPEYDRRY